METKQNLLFEWKDIKPQFNEEQQKFIEHTIWMAENTKEPQKFTIKVDNFEILSFVIFPSGLIYKINLEEDEEERGEK